MPLTINHGHGMSIISGNDSVFFLQNSVVPAVLFQERLTLLASQKILRTEVRKVWREGGFFMRFGPFFYDERKAGQEVYLTKEKKLVTLATVLVAISSPA